MFRSIGYFPSQLLLCCLHREQLGSSSLVQHIFPWCNFLHGLISCVSCLYLSLGNCLQATSKVLLLWLLLWITITIILLINKRLLLCWLYRVKSVQALVSYLSVCHLLVLWIYTETDTSCGSTDAACIHFRLAVHCASCLQCFDAVGWAAGRASGL